MFIARLSSAFRRNRAEDELSREMTAHLALLEDEHMRRGHDARRGATGRAPRDGQRRAREGPAPRRAVLRLARRSAPRSASRRPQSAPQPGIHADRRAGPWPRHRRQHHLLHARRRDLPARTAHRLARAGDVHVHARRAESFRQLLVRRVRRPPPARDGLRAAWPGTPSPSRSSADDRQPPARVSGRVRVGRRCSSCSATGRSSDARSGRTRTVPAVPPW